MTTNGYGQAGQYIINMSGLAFQQQHQNVPSGRRKNHFLSLLFILRPAAQQTKKASKKQTRKTWPTLHCARSVALLLLLDRLLCFFFAQIVPSIV
jgi:hypothetical protein